MIPQFLAEHQPFIRNGQAGVAPAPAPAVTPTPVASNNLVVQAIDELYIARGSVGPITLAAISGADPAPTIRVVSGIAGGGVIFGLSWSSGSGSVTATGTYLGPSAVYRVELEYIGAGGVLRGASTHEITAVSTTSLFTVATQVGLGGRLGVPVDATIATLSHPDPIVVEARPKGSSFGLLAELTWSSGSPSTGTLKLTGTPDSSGIETLRIEYVWQGLVIGQSTHTIDVGASATRPTPAAVPTPAPAAPPTLPAPPSLRPSSIQFSDPYLADRYLVLNADRAQGLSYPLPLDVPQYVQLWEQDIFSRFTDANSNGLEMFGVYPVSSDGGGVGFGFVAGDEGTPLAVRAPAFMSVDYPLRSSPGVLSEGEMTVEAFVKMDEATGALWSDTSSRTRWMPIVSAQAYRRQAPSTGSREQGWSLGLLSYVDPKTGARRVRPAFAVSLHAIVDNEDLYFFYDNNTGLVQPDRPWTGNTLQRMRYAAQTLWPTSVDKFGVTLAVGPDIAEPWSKWMHLAGQIHAHPSVSGAFVTSCWLEGRGGGRVDVFGPLPPTAFRPTYLGASLLGFTGTPVGVFHTGNPYLLNLRIGWMDRPAILDPGAGGVAPQIARDAGISAARLTPFSGAIASVRLSRRAEYTKSTSTTTGFRADLFPISWPQP